MLINLIPTDKLTAYQPKTARTAIDDAIRGNISIRSIKENGITRF